jgi:hypothetical protein
MQQSVILKHLRNLTAQQVGICEQSRRRYLARERPVPFTVGWAILHEAGEVGSPCPDLQTVVRTLAMSCTLAEIGQQVGLDGDTIGCYAAGRRRRVIWDNGVRLLRLAGVEVK